MLFGILAERLLLGFESIRRHVCLKEFFCPCIDFFRVTAAMCDNERILWLSRLHPCNSPSSTSVQPSSAHGTCACSSHGLGSIFTLRTLLKIANLVNRSGVFWYLWRALLVTSKRKSSSEAPTGRVAESRREVHEEQEQPKRICTPRLSKL